MISILVVCTGNTCRSAMAQELLDDAVDRSTCLGGRVKCFSAGTFACEGAEATTEAIAAMEKYGLSLERHRARQFTEELAEKNDIILAIDSVVFEQMEAIAPGAIDKMHTFIGYAEGMDGEQVEERFSITDPFDEGLEEYEICAEQIRKYAEKIIFRLENEFCEQ